MHLRLLSVLGCFALLATSALGQSPQSLPIPLNVREAIDKGTRTTTGQPGSHYWQNKADYTIHVTFDPQTRLVSGHEDIAYTNNSPDSLGQLLFKLYPNLYKKGAKRLQAVKPEDLTDGVSLTNLTIDGQSIPDRSVPGTDMGVPRAPLTPGKTTQVSLDFSYTLNKGSHIRTGAIDSGAFFIAYFFPRIAVYDDIDGWNRNPYLGHLEFYNDFCNFNVDITVPGDYLVWATGDLANRRDLLSPAINKRLDDAETKDGIATIVDTTDLKSKDFLHHADANTWKFRANDVTDFAFAVANHYIWKASSLVVDPSTGRRTRVDAAFNPGHKDYFEVIDFARKTVQDMSYRFPAWPYPYPHETVFDGLDQMEYPMMVNDNPLDNRSDAIMLTDHEIFHTMFPFYMGINETKYAWMDEGWASIGEWLISPMIDSTIVDDYGVSAVSSLSGREVDQPITTLSINQGSESYFINAYPKPAMGYYYVKDMLGDSLFNKALHQYISDWHGRHPIPTDFFGSMNRGSGRNLDWFWKAWFYDNGYPDLGIKKVTSSIAIVNIGGKPLPIDLNIEFKDGTLARIHRSIAVWEKGATVVEVPIGSQKPIKKITLGDVHTPDTHPADNLYTAP